MGGRRLATAFGQWRVARRLVERGAHATSFDAAALGLIDRLRESTTSSQHARHQVPARHQPGLAGDPVQSQDSARVGPAVELPGAVRPDAPVLARCLISG